MSNTNRDYWEIVYYKAQSWSSRRGICLTCTTWLWIWI